MHTNACGNLAQPSLLPDQSITSPNFLLIREGMVQQGSLRSSPTRVLCVLVGAIAQYEMACLQFQHLLVGTIAWLYLVCPQFQLLLVGAAA